MTCNAIVNWLLPFNAYSRDCINTRTSVSVWAQGNNDAVKRFQEVQEAYDILRDPQKRAMYDQVGHQGFQAGGGDGPQGFPGGFQGGFPFGRGGFQGGFAGQDMDEVLQNMAKDFFGRQGGMGGMGSMFSSYQVFASSGSTCAV